MAPLFMRGELRCVLVEDGGQCVMLAGAHMMPEWSAGNWDTRTLNSLVRLPAAIMPQSIF